MALGAAVIGSRPRMVEALKAPMLSVIEAEPGVTHSAALARLKREGRCSRGVRIGEAADAVWQLEADGAVERSGKWGWSAVSR